MKIQINKLLGNCDSLPAMPNVVVKALSIIKDESKGLKDLANIIAYDQSLTTLVLKLVNSSYYGMPQQITSITRAISLIGMLDVRNIVITVAMRPMLTSRGGKDLWTHSIKTAIATELIAKTTNIIDPNDAFVLGFLHDIGKIILNHSNPIVYNKIKTLAEKSKNIIEVENLLLGASHTEVGFILAKKWQLPIVIANCIKYHHSPFNSSIPKVVSLVLYADILVNDSFDDNVNILSRMNKLTGIDVEYIKLLKSEIEEKSEILFEECS